MNSLSCKLSAIILLLLLKWTMEIYDFVQNQAVEVYQNNHLGLKVQEGSVISTAILGSMIKNTRCGSPVRLWNPIGQMI